MVFLNLVRSFLHAANIKTCTLMTLTAILAIGCSGRGEKKVSITCAPGQTQGADGKCQAAASNQGGGTGSSTSGDDILSSTAGEPESTENDENPNDTPTPDLTPAPEDTPNDTPQTQQNPPINTPSTINTNKPPVTNSTPTATPTPIATATPPPSATPTTIPANDPINLAESATSLFKDAPQTTAEGPPSLAFKLINSPTQGKVARVAFSHTNGVTNTQYKYHKKLLTTTAPTTATAGTTTTADGSISIDLSTIPVSVTFEWNNKKCDSGLVEVDFEAKTKTATCI